MWTEKLTIGGRAMTAVAARATTTAMRENMASIMRDKPKGVREKSRDVMDDGSLGLWNITAQVYIPPHRQSGGANRKRLCPPERAH